MTFYRVTLDEMNRKMIVNKVTVNEITIQNDCQQSQCKKIIYRQNESTHSYCS